MAIYIYCEGCRKSLKIGMVKCGCGNYLKKNKKYRVREKLPSVAFKSKVVDNYELAKRVESKLKAQGVEEKVFNIYKAPEIGMVWRLFSLGQTKQTRMV